MKIKFAGITLDYFDDKGALIKQRFPTVESLPDVIKTANVRPLHKIADDQFALVAIDGGHVMKKYACYDPGTTAMSVMYFMEHGHKLPEDAQKTAAANLFNACMKHKLMPPERLTKTAMHQGVPHLEKMVALKECIEENKKPEERQTKPEEPVQPKPEEKKPENVVDITGKKPLMKTAQRPLLDTDYAYIADDGRRLFPIHDWDNIKVACDYWSQENKRMDPKLRRDFAVKVASKARTIGVHIGNEDLLEAGAGDYADTAQTKIAFEMRKLAMKKVEKPELDTGFLDDLMEKRASLHPEVFAECVRRFDISNGLERGWGSRFPDPYATTFGLQKTAEVIWESGAERVTRQKIENLAINHPGAVSELFTDELLKEFARNPVEIFNSLPLPQKKVMARLAEDIAHSGRAESSLTEDFGKSSNG